VTAEIWIGIDGGATKTIARVEDASGRLLGSGRAGPANIRASTAAAWEAIEAAIAQALEPSGLHLGDRAYRFYCGAGLAGTQVPAACQAFLSRPHPFAHLELQSDGYVACLGAHGGRDGAVIAIGTGVIAYQIAGDRVRRVGGWGFPQGDEGSGAWLGLELVRRTLHWHDGRAAAAPVFAALLARFAGDWTQFVIWANQADAQQFASLAPLVVEQAAAGDPVALGLLKEAAAAIDSIGRALTRPDSPPLPCSLLGGLAPFLEPHLEPALRSRLVPPVSDAASGAVLLARRAVAKGSASFPPLAPQR